MSIYGLIELARFGDKESMELLIVKFEPIINSLARKLKCECGKTDLIIFFMELIYGMNITNMINLSDGALVNYIKKSLYREYYRLSKKNSIMEVELIDHFAEENNEYKKVDFEIYLDELVMNKIINKNQKYALIKKYYNQCTDKEIAMNIGVSRQAVNKMQKVAIRNLKEYLIRV